MSLLSADFYARAATAVKSLDGNAALAAAVEKDVDAFFGRYPGLQRTRLTEAFIAGLVIEQLSTTADSQSAAQPNAENKKAA